MTGCINEETFYTPDVRNQKREFVFFGLRTFIFNPLGGRFIWLTQIGQVKTGFWYREGRLAVYLFRGVYRGLF
jgi:hypothetical protein